MPTKYAGSLSHSGIIHCPPGTLTAGFAEAAQDEKFAQHFYTVVIESKAFNVESNTLSTLPHARFRVFYLGRFGKKAEIKCEKKFLPEPIIYAIITAKVDGPTD